MHRPYPGLNFAAVKELDQSRLPFDKFTVEDPAGEKLGTLEGFIIDVNIGAPYYAVVNAGGWFRSKHFLIPIGHVALDSESGKLTGDVPKSRLAHFPGFDLDLFPKLSREDLDRMAQEIRQVCCPECTIEPAELTSAVEVWAIHFRTPAWWDGRFYQPGPIDEDAKSLPGTRR